MSPRPTKHFTPLSNWINDPNGLIFHEGFYHLFFQHNPFENKWGHMSWGHARSKDLIKWEELPVAIPEQSDHAIFSGCTVFDAVNNRLVAIYTGAAKSNQSQYLAYSYDGGVTWQEIQKVLDLNMENFRDPKVIRFQEKWIMAVAKSNEYKISFFESLDLLNWNFLSDFHAPEIQDIYECPDLFELDGSWVLIISSNPGNPLGGSTSRYFVGDFDGKEFKPKGSVKFFDLGPDNYAVVTFYGTAEKIAIGWMNNWHYANEVKREIWNGSMTAARKLRISDGKLSQSFIGESKFFNVDSDVFQFNYQNGALKFRVVGDKLEIDRSELWDATIARFQVPISGPFEIEALFDAGSIEMFINGDSVTILLLVGSETPELSVGPA